jgi:hypothetical protein
MKQEDSDKVNEPSPFYGMRIIFDSSLDAQQEDQYAYWQSLSGEQRLALATSLTEAFYRNTTTPDDKRIHFDI